MATTLSFGFVKPQSGDRGSVFFPALEDNIQQLNDHTHDGADSAKIPSSSVTATTASADSASWSSLGSGRYRQAITMPAGMDFDDYQVICRDSATGHQVLATIEKINDSSFYVYTNDNSLTYGVYFLS